MSQDLNAIWAAVNIALHGIRSSLSYAQDSILARCECVLLAVVNDKGLSPLGRLSYEQEQEALGWLNDVKEQTAVGYDRSCPVKACNNSKSSYHLTCQSCWKKVPSKDQAELYRLYREQPKSASHVKACYDILLVLNNQEGTYEI